MNHLNIAQINHMIFESQKGFYLSYLTLSDSSEDYLKFSLKQQLAFE